MKIMNKYILHGCIIVFLVIIGVGLVSEIDNGANIENEVSSFEERIEGEGEIEDGNLSEVKIEKEDTSNLISNINAKLASIVVDILNEGLKIVVNIISSVTN